MELQLLNAKGVLHLEDDGFVTLKIKAVFIYVKFYGIW